MGFLGKILNYYKSHILSLGHICPLLTSEQGLYSVQHLLHYQHLINAK